MKLEDFIKQVMLACKSREGIEIKVHVYISMEGNICVDHSNQSSNVITVRVGAA